MENNISLLTPIKAMRKKCLNCMCGSFKEVSLCPSVYCSLYPYRFGKRPNQQKRVLTPQQKMEAADRAEKARQAKKFK